jgi:hypothetical protein
MGRKFRHPSVRGNCSTERVGGNADPEQFRDFAVVGWPSTWRGGGRGRRIASRQKSLVLLYCKQRTRPVVASGGALHEYSVTCSGQLCDAPDLIKDTLHLGSCTDVSTAMWISRLVSEGNTYATWAKIGPGCE